MEDHRVNFDEGVTITIEVVGGCYGKQAIAHAVGDLRDSVVESMPEMISGGYVFKFGRAINNYSGDTYLTPIGTAHYDNELVETKSKLEKVTGEYAAMLKKSEDDETAKRLYGDRCALLSSLDLADLAVVVGGNLNLEFAKLIAEVEVVSHLVLANEKQPGAFEEKQVDETTRESANPDGIPDPILGQLGKS